MEDSSDSLVAGPAELTTAWLTTALGCGKVAAFRYDRIGTGQVSDCYRIDLEYAGAVVGPQSVVLKVAAQDPTSRETGAAMGLYASEVRFYRELVPQLSAGPVARCFHAAIDPDSGTFDLLLADAAPAVVGDEIRGATGEQAAIAVRELGRLHALVAARPELLDAEWLDRSSLLDQALLEQLYVLFLERYGKQTTVAQRSVCDALVGAFDHYLALVDTDARGLVHGDYRLDNMLFGTAAAEQPLTVVDWQGVMAGPASTDLAYFLGGALTVETRRAGYDELLRAYHRALGAESALTPAQVRESVRRQSFMGVVMSIAASVVVERTDRGDRLFTTMLARHCAHVLDTGALELLLG
ncbi:phosphotransferase [Nocardia sp. NPDC003963]